MINELCNIVFEYSVDNGSWVMVDFIGFIDVMFDQGDYLICYYVIDCVGNVDFCDFFVFVVDCEVLEIICLMLIIVMVDLDFCQKILMFFVFLSVIDNCEVYMCYECMLLLIIGEVYLQFFLDFNLNDYLFGGWVFFFDDVLVNVYSDVDIIVDLQGDFNINGVFVNIFGDDGSMLLIIIVGVVDCFIFVQIMVIIFVVIFNIWVVDGQVNLEIVLNDIIVFFGVLGDGINFCNFVIV